MELNYIAIFVILPLAAVAAVQYPDARRILHQPLFPATSAPPSPPPPATPDVSVPDQPFFHELPNGQTPDQGGQQQQQPPPTSNTEVANPAPTRAPNLSKKMVIVITAGVVTLGVLSALAFYLYKHRRKVKDDSQKLVGGNSQRIHEGSRMPPSTFLYIGTVEPSAVSLANEANGIGGDTGSPYRKINLGKGSDRYRPSPDLQPLPPLPKPPPPPNINSPPPMSSSDDDSHDTNFYTPQGSSMSNESLSSRQNSADNRAVGNVPHSKRTSPKSKPVIIPSIKPPSPPAAASLGQLQPSKSLSYIPKRANFPAPPPPPDMSRLRSIENDDRPASKVPTPPPPPPPPTQLSVPKQFVAKESYTPPPIPKQVINSGLEETSSSVESNKSVNSSDNIDEREDKEGSKPRLKPLHWDKVRATSDRATVWDQLKSSSFQLNEDAMESLFGCNSTNSAPKELTRKSFLPTAEHENKILDPKKSQNIAILLRALNVTREEVSEALLNGNSEGLGPELLETLVRMAPNREEEMKLKDYNGESSKLGSAERFLKGILDIPLAFKRVEAMLYRANFDAEVTYLRKSFQTLEEASEELKNSRLFLKLLEAVLRTGNRMNDGTNRGDARAFKLDTLLKLVDVKGTDGKTTLLHFVVQEIIRSEGANSDPGTETQQLDTMNAKLKEEEFRKQGLQVVSGLSKELGNVKSAAGMDSDVLSSYVTKLEMGLEKVRLVMQYEKQSTQCKFFDSTKEFLKDAGEEIARIKDEEKKALCLVKEVTEYFHGDAAKEEAHPFRIFMIVRDFLSILDNVCKDVGRMQDRATVGTGRSFRMPASASLPVLNRYNLSNDPNSDDDHSM